MAETTPLVLIVDAEERSRQAIRDALSQASFACATAETGEGALRCAEDAHTGVVVLDLRLPDTSGLELLNRLRAARPQLRVIVLSAPADQDDVLEALRCGACDYLAKPLHREELVLAVRRALEIYVIESSWMRLRGKLRTLERRLGELAACGWNGQLENRLERVDACAARAAAELLGATKTSLLVLDEETDELRVRAATGDEQRLAEMNPVAAGGVIAGLVLASGKPLLVSDVSADPRFAGHTVADRYDSPSMAIAPVLCGERSVGVLCAADREGGEPFGEEDLALLRILALQIGPLLADRGGRTEEEGAEDTQPLGVEGAGDAELARAVCDALTTELEPQRLLEAALRAAGQRIPAAPISLYLLDGRSGALSLEAEWAGEGPGDRATLPANAGLTGTVLLTGQLVATDRPDADPRFAPQADTPGSGEAAALLCVPLKLRGTVMGVLRAFPAAGAIASAGTGEVLSAAFSAAVRNVLLYRSLLESVDEVARARRETRGAR